MIQPAVDQPPRPALLICTAAVILVVDWSVPVLTHGLSLSGAVRLILLAFFTAQIPLHSAWVVFGPGSLLVRIVGLLPGMLIGLLYLEAFPAEMERDVVACKWGALWMLTIAVWLGFAMRGIRLVRGGNADVDAGLIQASQFGLVHLLAATTVFGVTTSIVTQAGRAARHLQDPMTWLSAALMAMFCILLFPAMLFPERSTRTNLAFWSPITIVILVMLFTPGETLLAVGITFGVVLALELIVLTAARLDGYRLQPA